MQQVKDRAAENTLTYALSIVSSIPAEAERLRETCGNHSLTIEAGSRVIHSRFLHLEDDLNLGVTPAAYGRNRFELAQLTWSEDLVLRETCDRKELPMKKAISQFLTDESGATAIEYGLIAAGISVVIIVAVNTLGATLLSKFQFINSKMGG